MTTPARKAAEEIVAKPYRFLGPEGMQGLEDTAQIISRAIEESKTELKAENERLREALELIRLRLGR